MSIAIDEPRGATTLRTRWWFSCPAGSRSDWHRTGTDTENSGGEAAEHGDVNMLLHLKMTCYYIRRSQNKIPIHEADLRHAEQQVLASLHASQKQNKLSVYSRQRILIHVYIYICVCICMYIYVFIYLYLFIYTFCVICGYTYMQIYIHRCTYKYIHVFDFTCAHTELHARMHTCHGMPCSRSHCKGPNLCE